MGAHPRRTEKKGIRRLRVAAPLSAGAMALALFGATGVAQADPFSWSSPYRVAGAAGSAIGVFVPVVPPVHGGRSGERVRGDVQPADPRADRRPAAERCGGRRVRRPHRRRLRSVSRCTSVDSSGVEVTYNPTSPFPHTWAQVDAGGGDVGPMSDGIAFVATTLCTAIDQYPAEASFNPSSPPSIRSRRDRCGHRAHPDRLCAARHHQRMRRRR
jgi:hypothetical protein